jgi:enterobactin synthetase component D
VTFFIGKVSKFNVETLPNLNIFQCIFDVTAFNSMLFQQFSIYYPENIQVAVNKRKSEFLAGRYCAKQALAAHNINGYTIGSFKNRAPAWPKGYIGSITHTSDRAYSIVVKNTKYSGMGIDAEYILSNQQIVDIKGIVTTDSEFNFLIESQLDISIAFTLAFSAKESLFKALNPIVNKFFDFLDVEIIELGTNKFRLFLEIDLSATYKAGRTFEGHYVVNKSQIITIITI